MHEPPAPKDSELSPLARGTAKRAKVSLAGGSKQEYNWQRMNIFLSLWIL